MPEYNNLLIDLANSNFVKAAPVVNQMQEYKDSVEQEKKMKPRLFTYPQIEESSTVFDYEDLMEDQFLVLCVRPQFNVPGHEHDSHRVFIWRGPEFEEDDEGLITANEFVDKVMEEYWGCKNPADQFNIEIINELFGAESEEFTDYF